MAICCTAQRNVLVIHKRTQRGNADTQAIWNVGIMSGYDCDVHSHAFESGIFKRMEYQQEHQHVMRCSFSGAHPKRGARSCDRARQHPHVE